MNVSAFQHTLDKIVFVYETMVFFTVSLFGRSRFLESFVLSLCVLLLFALFDCFLDVYKYAVNLFDNTVCFSRTFFKWIVLRV